MSHLSSNFYLVHRQFNIRWEWPLSNLSLIFDKVFNECVDIFWCLLLYPMRNALKKFQFIILNVLCRIPGCRHRKSSVSCSKNGQSWDFYIFQFCAIVGHNLVLIPDETSVVVDSPIPGLKIFEGIFVSLQQLLISFETSILIQNPLKESHIFSQTIKFRNDGALEEENVPRL